MAVALDDSHSDPSATTLPAAPTVEPVASLVPEGPVAASLLRWRVSTNLPLHLPPLFGRENDLEQEGPEVHDGLLWPPKITCDGKPVKTGPSCRMLDQ